MAKDLFVFFTDFGKKIELTGFQLNLIYKQCDTVRLFNPKLHYHLPSKAETAAAAAEYAECVLGICTPEYYVHTVCVDVRDMVFAFHLVQVLKGIDDSVKVVAPVKDDEGVFIGFKEF